MKHVVLTIDGMTCQGCVRSVRTVLTAVPGVTVRDVSVGAADLDVDAARVTDATLRQAIDDAGFTVLGVASP